jgi:protease-4
VRYTQSFQEVLVRRALVVVLVLILGAVAVSATGLVALWVMVGREPGVPSSSTLVLRLAGDPVEGGPEDGFRQFLPVSRPESIREIVLNIRKAKVDRRVQSLVVSPVGIGTPYMAKLQELHGALIDFRRSGKPAIAYLEDGSQAAYYLATACDRIYLMPTSPLQLTGLANYELFLRGTLDKIGAYPDMLHVGQYKTAVNQLTEKTFTPPHREMVESLNRDTYDQLIKAIADARGKSEAEVRAIVDEGPFLPEEAVRAGLVDDVAYEDQLDDKAKVNMERGRRIDGRNYSGVSARSLGLNRGERVAVLYATGTIVSGRSGFDPLNGEVVGSDTLIDSIRKIRARDDIKAVVLRVDSPGGSATASDAIWRELVLLRDATPQKPLVVSMSDLAASGGYYIAMAAPYIVAEPGTLTGSIGIFGGKIALGGTYGKLGANIESVTSGRHADIYSPVRPFNDEERAKLGEQLQAFYDQFVEKAAAARGTTPEKIDAVAQGRVWTGRQAKGVGLVDDLGGLERALEVAKQRAKIPADAEVEIVVYPPRRSFYEVLTAPFAAAPDLSSLLARIGGVSGRGVGIATAPATLFRAGEPLALMPFGFLR